MFLTKQAADFPACYSFADNVAILSAVVCSDALIHAFSRLMLRGCNTLYDDIPQFALLPA